MAAWQLLLKPYAKGKSQKRPDGTTCQAAMAISQGNIWQRYLLERFVQGMYNQSIRLFSSTCPANLTLSAFYMPFSSPQGWLARANPAARVIDNRAFIKGNRQRASRWFFKITPGGIPGGTENLVRLLLQHHAHQIEVVNSHI